MSGFLQKLKSGGVAVDNTAPPDSTGAITRRIEKHYANEPASSLGLELSADAEVLRVHENSPASVANIPVGFMVFEVNNEYVESDHQFENAAARNLNLVIKLQATTSMSELIGRILQEEETASMEEVRQKIGLDELSRTTPRFSFLAGDHPIFRRYTSRLRARREAAAMVRQRLRETEERMQRENREKIRKEIEAAKAEARRAEEKAKKEEELRAALPLQRPQTHPAAEQESFIQVFEDHSAFGQNHADAEQPASTKKPDAPQVSENSKSAEIEIKEEIPLPPSADEVGKEHDNTGGNENEEKITPATTSELLALLGMPTDNAVPTDEGILGNPDPRPLVEVLKQPVRYVILPSEEYTLKNGEKVILSLKSRSGPFPTSPPGKPPKISREARKALELQARTGKRERSSSSSSSSDSSRLSQREKSRKSNCREKSRRDDDRDRGSDRKRDEARDRRHARDRDRHRSYSKERRRTDDGRDSYRRHHSHRRDRYSRY